MARNAEIQPGRNVLRLTVSSVAGKRAVIGLTDVKIGISSKEQIPPSAIITAGATSTAVDKNYVVTRASKDGGKGDTLYLYTLMLGRDTADAQGFEIAPNAAVFDSQFGRILVWSGMLDGIGEAEFGVLTKDMLFARGLKSIAGRTMEKTQDVEWALSDGKYKDHDLSALLKTVRECVAAEESAAGNGGTAVSALPFEQGTSLQSLPSRPTAWKIVDETLAAASGKELRVQSLDGNVLLGKTLDKRVTCLGYSPSEEMYLLGLCEKGKRITTLAAMDKDGNTLREAALEDPKGTHHYHNHRALPGVFAIATDDKRIFTGSASCVSIFSLDGKLVKNYLHPWGRVRILLPVNGDLFATTFDRSCFLNVSRIDGDGKLVSGWNDNMPGFKEFKSFGAMYRSHLFAADFDGDGNIEILGDGQGAYTWLNMYTLAGKPKHQVNLAAEILINHLA